MRSAPKKASQPPLPEAIVIEIGRLPASELEGVARLSSTDWVVVASAKPISQDRFSRYRASTFQEVSARILNQQAG
jgi:hypothetical protein